MGKYVFNLQELDDCNTRLKQAITIINDTTKEGETFFAGLNDAWEGAAADAFAYKFRRLNTKIEKSVGVLDALIEKNTSMKNDIIQTDKATKHVDEFTLLMHTWHKL